jgi:hypothetical protein
MGNENPLACTMSYEATDNFLPGLGMKGVIVKKNTAQRLTLNRETIQRLEGTALLKIAAGGDGCPLPDSMSGNLATSTCAPAGGG